MNIIVRKGYYRENKTGRIVAVEQVIRGQNEIYGVCSGAIVISDHATIEEFQYLGVTSLSVNI